MQKGMLVPHHRKLFWVAAAMGMTGLLLLVAARLTALGFGGLANLPVATSQYAAPVGEKVGLALLGVAAALFAWAWHLMTKGRFRRG
jgi:hypothetical protein